VTVTRRTALEVLAAHTDAEAGRTAAVPALAATVDTTEAELLAHLEALVDCRLAVRSPDGTFRISVTGEELLALEPEGPVVVDVPRNGGRGSVDVPTDRGP